MGIATTQTQLQENCPALMCSCTSSQKVGKAKSLINLAICLINKEYQKITCKFKIQVPSMSDSRKRENNPNYYTRQNRKKIEKLFTEGHITKLDKGTSDCFIALIVIKVKKDDSTKFALDAKPINRQLFKNKNQMPNVDELKDGVSQIITENKEGTLYFSALDLKYAYSQLKLAADAAKQCNFNIVEGYRDV